MIGRISRKRLFASQPFSKKGKCFQRERNILKPKLFVVFSVCSYLSISANAKLVQAKTFGFYSSDCGYAQGKTSAGYYVG
jgi:hypothetical protein